MPTISLPGLFDWTQVQAPAPPDAQHNPQGAQLFLDQNPEFDNRIAPIQTQPVGPSTDFVPNPDRAAKIGFFDQLAAGNPDAWLAVQAKNEREQAAVQEQNNLKRAAVGAINQNPDLIWDDPRWIAGMTPEQQWDAYQQHLTAYRAGDPIADKQGKALATPEFAQGITDLVIANHDDPSKSNSGLLGEDWINDWVWGVHALFTQDPQAFLEWEKNNPEMAIRWHAQMGERFGGESNTTNWGMDKFNHNERARALAYERSQELGYGKDGKNDGKIIAPNYKTLDDVSNKSGSSDFWKIGTPQSLTDGIGNWIEDNPWETAALIASTFLAPAAGSAVSGAVGGTAGTVAGAATTGAVAGAGASAATGGDILEGALLGAVTGGIASAPAVQTVASTLGVSDDIAKGLIKAGSAVAQGKNPQDAMIGLGLDIGLPQLEQALDNPQFAATLEGLGLSGGSASRESIVDMVEAGATGGDLEDVLLSGLERYAREDGRLVGGDLDMPDWLSGDFLAGIDLPSFDMPNIDVPNIDMPDFDLPNWRGSESGIFNLPNIDTPNWAGSESVDLPNWEGSESIDLPDFDMPNIDAPNIPTPDFNDVRWNPDFDLADIKPDIDTPGFGDDIPGNEAQKSEPSIVESLFSAPLDQSLFGYTKLTPAQAARLPAPMNYVKGLFS